MKRKGQHHKATGKPPRWLVLGALASTALSARPALSQQVEESKDRSAYREPTPPAVLAQRLDLDLAALPTRNATARRFDIPPGPLGAALDAFQEATGLSVELADESIRELGTQGVHGVFSAEKALQELLAGTGVTYRFTASSTVMVELPPISETMDVVAPMAPVSPKYTEPLRDTPQTITVVPQSVIEERGATTLREVLRNVTGISLQAGEGGSSQGDSLTIRGFAAQNDIFVDGVRDFGAYSRDPFNVEQVEVAKGPSSMYVGRGSTGGSVNLATKTPHLNASRDAMLSGGSDEFGRAQVDVNQPIEAIEGAAFRLNGMWTHADIPGRDAVENERWGIAPSIAFGLDTPTRTTVSYSRLQQDNVPDHGIPWVPATNVPLAAYANKPAPVDYDNFYGITSRDYEKTITNIGTGEVVHDFNSTTTLRSLVRYGESSRDAITTSPRFLSNDSTVIRRELQSRDQEDSVLAQQNDLTYRFTTGRFTTGEIGHVLVTGTEVSREISENHLRTAPPAPNADLFHPNPEDPFTGPVVRTGAKTKSTAKTVAVYAADTVKLGERWELNGGLRWDRFDVDFDSVAVGGALTELGRVDNMVSWRAGIINKPRPNGTIYVAAGTSFNPAAEANNGLTLNATTADLEPEESRSYELGTKWDFPSNRLSLTSAVFQTEKVNAKTPGLNPGDPATVLDGEQRIRGFELGVTGNLTERWSTSFSYTFLKSKITKSNNAVEVGNEFANTPDHSISLWTTYRLPRGLEVGAGAQYVGERKNSTTTIRVAPPYTVVDAMVSYPLNQLLSFRLNVNNLADERYIDRLSGGHFVPGPSRSVALTTSFNF